MDPAGNRRRNGGILNSPTYIIIEDIEMCKHCDAINAICAYADEQYKIMKPEIEKLVKHSKKLVEESRQYREQLKQQFPSFFN